MQQPDPRWCALLRPRPPARAASSAPPEVPAAPSEPDRVDFDPAYDPRAPIGCEVCGFRMHYTGACKILCANCGYKRDCSDP